MLDFGQFRLRPIDFGQTGRSRNWPKSKLIGEVEQRCLLSLSFLLFLFMFLFCFVFFFHFSFLLLFAQSQSSFCFCFVLVPKKLELYCPLDNPPPDNPPPDNPSPDRPKFRSFPCPCVGILVVFLRAKTLKCAHLGSRAVVVPRRLRGRRPGLHTTTRELQTPDASNTTKIPRKDPQENERRKKIVGGSFEKKKKREILGPPPFGAPPRPPPSGPPPFRASTLRGPLWSKNWPNSKLAEIDIGRSRVISKMSGF